MSRFERSQRLKSGFPAFWLKIMNGDEHYTLSSVVVLGT